jgi:hypothetical protein
VFSRPRALIREVAINVIIIFVIYSTLGGMFAIWNIRLQPDTLPNHRLIRDLFYIYGVFGSYDLVSSEYLAVGSGTRRADVPASPDKGMNDLHIYNYFPQWRGEAHRRISLLGYRYSGVEFRKEAYRRMADTIMRKHNTANPDAQVAQVYIYIAEWPADNLGYKERYYQRKYRLIGNN